MAKKKTARKATPSPKTPRKTQPASIPSSPEQPTAGQALAAFVQATKSFASGQTTAHIALPPETIQVEVSWYEKNPPDGAGIVGAGTAHTKRTSLVSRTIETLMLEAARRWPGEANVLQITFKGKGARGKAQQELLDFARAAWCEVLGQTTLDQGEVAGLKSSQQARLLTLLRGGAAGIREWNQEHGSFEKPNPAWDVTDFAGVDLSGVALAGVSLAHLDWARCNLSKADLSKAGCNCVNWTAANLADANLSGASLINSSCERADFSRANLADARLGFSNFRRAKLVNADLRGADLMQTDLIGADLTGAQLDNARLAGAKFNETTLWPAGYAIPTNAAWKGKGPDPRTHATTR